MADNPVRSKAPATCITVNCITRQPCFSLGLHKGYHKSNQKQHLDKVGVTMQKSKKVKQNTEKTANHVGELRGVSNEGHG